MAGTKSEAINHDEFQRCIDGDRAAQEKLFRNRSGQVYRWAVFLGLGPADAEDAAQEVLATSFRRIHRCRSAEVFNAWLFQITRRVVANHRRLAWWKRILLTDEPERAAFVGRSAVEKEEELELRRCLNQLPRKLAEVLLLVEVEGYTRGEVAKMLDIPDGTVASRLRIARTALQKKWDKGNPTTSAQLSWREP